MGLADCTSVTGFDEGTDVMGLADCTSVTGFDEGTDMLGLLVTASTVRRYEVTILAIFI
jgi:hypothetical protein